MRLLRERQYMPACLPKIISLFSGGGGLDAGFYAVQFPIAFAVDISPAAVASHQRNFPQTLSIAADLTKIGPEGVLAYLDQVLEPGEPVAVIGGPPCQGFSRANPASSPDDPRNKLPILYLQVVEAIQANYPVQFVLFENVLGIRDRKHEETYMGVLRKFNELGFATRIDEYCALDYGVAQSRKRVIIAGFLDGNVASSFAPKKIVSSKLTVRDKIGGFPEPVFYSRMLDQNSIPYHQNHWTMRPISKRFSEPGGVSSRGRSFRRLEWDKPSPTVAYGHREIHVHPNGHRRLSIYEAMILQGFPSSFVLKGNFSDQVQQVSNAVPPPVAQALAQAMKDAL